jgi:hypothetical protein
MTSVIPNPERPDERRIMGEELVTFFHRFPNMVAWVNGHHHVNAITPIPDPSGLTPGFWDINTASHVDYPQHARVVEVVDNRDGTISFCCTMLEHMAPAATDPGDLSAVGLAAISRELSANDPQSNREVRLGRDIDLNVELVLTAPFDLQAAGITGAAPTTAATVPGSAPADGTGEAGDDSDEGNSENNTATLIAGGVIGLAVVGGGAAVATRRKRAGDEARSYPTREGPE